VRIRWCSPRACCYLGLLLEALSKTAGDYAKELAAQLPLARLGVPEDHVQTRLFLLSAGASWITGQVVNVDGGQMMRP